MIFDEPIRYGYVNDWQCRLWILGFFLFAFLWEITDPAQRRKPEPNDVDRLD